LKHFDESVLFALKKHVAHDLWNPKTEKAWVSLFAMVADKMSIGIELQAGEKNE
jgi:hypothetical protein